MYTRGSASTSKSACSLQYNSSYLYVDQDGQMEVPDREMETVFNAKTTTPMAIRRFVRRLLDAYE